MRAYDINVGDVLELKPERQRAYGMASPFVCVTGFRHHKRMKRVFVLQHDKVYLPSDFKRKARS